MSVEMNLRNRIAVLLRAGLVAVQEAGDLPAFDVPEMPPVEQSRHAAHGDYGSPICLELARVLNFDMNLNREKEDCGYLVLFSS